MSGMGGFNHFPQLIATLPAAADKLARATAFKIQAQAQHNAPIRTGFLRTSIYVVTATESTYGQGLVGDGPILPPVNRPKLGTAIIAVGAAYGAYIEFGTRYRPPHPFLQPAADRMMPAFKAAFALLETKWREAGG